MTTLFAMRGQARCTAFDRLRHTVPYPFAAVFLFALY
jgi:hypothetical protein